MLTANGRRDENPGVLKVLFNEEVHLREGVDALEKDILFLQFVKAAQDQWAGDFHRLPGPTCGDLEWPTAVGNTLRRCGFYHAIIRGSADITFTAQRLEAAFLRREANVTYLAPLEYISLKGSEFDFGDFAVKRFTKNDLDNLLEVRACRSFFPRSAYETDLLHQLHFAVVHGSSPSTQIGNPFHKLQIDLSDVGKIPVRFSRFPEGMEAALATLALFPWQEDHWKYGSGGGDLEGAFSFGVPFLIRIDDDLLDRPKAANDCNDLAEDPDPERNQPYFLCCLDDNEEDHFRALIGGVVAVVQRFGGWKRLPMYLANAMGFILKACFSEPRDGMLWNTVAIEALLGRNEQSLQRSIGRRLEWIGAVSEAEFKKVYEQRCALVHGSVDAPKEREVGGKAPLARNAKEVQEIARRTVLWFMNLEAAKRRLPAPVQLPAHEAILDLLDYRPSTRNIFKEFLAAMPDGFPKIDSWTQGMSS